MTFPTIISLYGRKYFISKYGLIEEGCEYYINLILDDLKQNDIEVHEAQKSKIRNLIKNYWRLANDNK